MPTKKIPKKCQIKPFILSLLDSIPIQIVQTVAVMIKSQLNPEMTQVAKGADQNKGQP
jgi:hypothetical protein